MIESEEYYGTRGDITEQPIDRTRVAELSFEEGKSYNPVQLGLEYLKSKEVNEDMVPKEKIDEFAKSEGVTLKKTPDSMSREAMYMMVERQYQKKMRSAFLENGPDGIGTTIASLGGSFAASFMDPIGFAANFIPVVGEARYAGMLAKAGSTAGRLGVRAGVGAAEGMVGAAILEIPTLPAAQALGDDYTLADSVVGTLAGGLMGAVAHVGISTPSEIGRYFREGTLKKETAALAEVERSLNAKSFAERQEKRMATEKEILESMKSEDVRSLRNQTDAEYFEIMQSAIAMSEQNSKIDINHLLDTQKASVALRHDAARNVDPIAFQAMDEINARVNENKFKIEEQEKRISSSEAVVTAQRISEIESKLNAPEKNKLSGEDVVSLEKELKKLEKKMESESFLKNIEEVDSAEKQIEFLNKENDRISSNPDIQARISEAYQEGGKVLASRKVKPEVAISSNDRHLRAYSEGRVDSAPRPGEVKEAVINHEAAIKNHNEIFSNGQNNAFVSRPLNDEMDLQVQNLMKKLEKQEAKVVADLDMADLQILAETIGYNIDHLKEQFDAPVTKAKERMEIAKRLLPCVAGVK